MLATPATVVEWQIRAWWSQLLVPKNDTNLRIRYDCSLLCFERPTQKIASGPDSFLIARILSPTSLIAWSHEIRCPLAVDELHRRLQPMRMLDDPVLAHRRALGAVRAEIDRRLEHRLLARPHAVLDRRVDRAADRAVRAHRALLLDLRAVLLRLRGRRSRRSGSWLANAPAPAARPERLRNVRRSIVDRRATCEPLEARAGRRRAIRLARQQHGRPPQTARRSRSNRGCARSRDNPSIRWPRAFTASTAFATGTAAAAAPALRRTECEQEAAAFDVGGRLRRIGGALRGDWLMRTSKEYRRRDVMLGNSIDGERVTFDRHEQTSEFCYPKVVVGNRTLRYCIAASIDPAARGIRRKTVSGPTIGSAARPGAPAISMRIVSQSAPRWSS